MIYQRRRMSSEVIPAIPARWNQNSTCISHWDVLENDGGSATPFVDTRSIRAVIPPGSLLLKSERGLNGCAL